MMMTTTVAQNSLEWHQFRAAHFGASEAPVMLGISQYKSRNDLLREKATGIVPEVDAGTQCRFDDGHRFEALARPLAEKIIGEDLAPLVGYEGKLSASFDGITFDRKTTWEHKSLNEKLREAMKAGNIPEQYRAQMEQQLMLAGADRCLFMASVWTDADELGEEMHLWYESDPSMRQRIIHGWTQFAIDLENYQHVEHAEKPKAEVVIDLPALFVHARGEITTHNMDEFGKALVARLAEVRAIALVTDQDFSNAKEAAKKFRETAKAIAKSKEQMLAQTETIGEAARKMDAWAKDLNATALQLEKDVEREDLAKKESIVLGAKSLLADHIAALENEIKPIRLNLAAPNFAEAIKGKRNYASMQDAVDTALAGAKIEADAAAKDIRAKLAWCRDHVQEFGRYEMLFADRQVIFQKPMDDFQLTITSRIDSAKRAEAERLEAERARIAAEEKVKAEREAAAKLAVEEARIRAEVKREADAAQLEVMAMLEAHQKSIDEQRAAQTKDEGEKLEELRGKTVDATHADRERAGMPQAPAASTPPYRPTDKELIEFVAQFFEVSFGTACDWVIETAERMKVAA